MSHCSDFPQFVSLVATKVGAAVNRLPAVSVSCPLNEFVLERAEYRLSRSGGSESTTSGVIQSEKIMSQTGERALVDCGIDVVRVSLKIAYEGPDASVLTRELESKFFSRLARSGVACIRKKRIENYDITLLFTCHDDGEEVEKLLRSFLPVCRTLSKQLRLSQVVENRRAGRNVFSKLVQVVPKSRLVTTPTGIFQEDQQDEGEANNESVVTEIGDMGNLEDLRDEEIDKTENIFLI